MSRCRMFSIATCIFVLVVSNGRIVSGAVPDSSGLHVETFRLESKVFGNSREIRVFLPPSYRQNNNRRYPVLYLNDGFAVFKSTLWNAPAVVSRLIAEKKIPEMILVGIDNGATASGGSPDQRTREYLPYPDSIHEPSVLNPLGARYPDFLIDEVIPAVAKRYRIKEGAENTGIGGSSYGALAALFTVIHRPNMFGRLLLESAPTFMAGFKIFEEAESLRDWPGRVSVGIGTKETEDEELNRTAIPNCERLKNLITKKSPTTIVELTVGQGDSHNSKSWSRRLPHAIEFLFGSDGPARKDN